MKKTFLLLISLAILGGVQAQTFNEWFRQKKTKIRYLVEQIAALKAYTGVVGKGYSVAQKGLSTISGIKRGDLQLHEDYFSSLRTVSPAVRNYWKREACGKLDLEILKSAARIRTTLQAGTVLTAAEMMQARKVLERMLDHRRDLMEQLLKVTSDGTTSLTDAERIGQIDVLYTDLNEFKSALLEYGGSLSLFIMQKTRELQDLQGAERLYQQ